MRVGSWQRSTKVHHLSLVRPNFIAPKKSAALEGFAKKGNRCSCVSAAALSGLLSLGHRRVSRSKSPKGAPDGSPRGCRCRCAPQTPPPPRGVYFPPPAGENCARRPVWLPRSSPSCGTRRPWPRQRGRAPSTWPSCATTACSACSEQLRRGPWRSRTPQRHHQAARPRFCTWSATGRASTVRDPQKAAGTQPDCASALRASAACAPADADGPRAAYHCKSYSGKKLKIFVPL